MHRRAPSSLIARRVFVCLRAGKSTFAFTRTNHNSVLGMREFAKSAGCAWQCIDQHPLFSSLTAEGRNKDVQRSARHKIVGDADAPNLFAMPAECNFSGSKADLTSIEQVHNGELGGGKWYVLLDAAKLVPTSPLDLTKVRPDFVALSFYKMFGLPAGLGALLVRRDAVKAGVLRKRYFSGGTVLAVRADEDVYKLREDFSQRFEDGTPPVASILAGMKGFLCICRWAFALRCIPMLSRRDTGCCFRFGCHVSYVLCHMSYVIFRFGCHM